jgi:hypothetical protein
METVGYNLELPEEIHSSTVHGIIISSLEPAVLPNSLFPLRTAEAMQNGNCTPSRRCAAAELAATGATPPVASAYDTHILFNGKIKMSDQTLGLVSNVATAIAYYAITFQLVKCVRSPHVSVHSPAMS